MGAGGLLCSTLEVVERGRAKTGKNLGCDIFVDKIPVKYEMDNCDKLISESQERMLVVVNINNIQRVKSIFEKWDLESEIVGVVDVSGNYTVYNHDKQIYSKNIEEFETITQDWDLTSFNYQETNKELVLQNNLWETYDSTIGCRTLESNRMTNENYSIIRIHEIEKNLIVSWSDDFDECYQKIIKKNFRPLGLVNCLNYGHPSDSMGEMSKYLELLNVKCVAHSVPVLGGNVSLYNATDGVSINPSPILVMIGIENT